MGLDFLVKPSHKAMPIEERGKQTPPLDGSSLRSPGGGEGWIAAILEPVPRRRPLAAAGGEDWESI